MIDGRVLDGRKHDLLQLEGYEIDIGLHHLGGFRDARPGIRAVLDPLGIDLSFRALDPDGFDTLLFEDMTFAVPTRPKGSIASPSFATRLPCVQERSLHTKVAGSKPTTPSQKARYHDRNRCKFRDGPARDRPTCKAAAIDRCWV